MADDMEMTDAGQQQQEQEVSSRLSFAQRYLEKHGWKEGKGLGARGEGRSEAVVAERRPFRQGLGAGRSSQAGTKSTFGYGGRIQKHDEYQQHGDGAQRECEGTGILATLELMSHWFGISMDELAQLGHFDVTDAQLLTHRSAKIRGMPVLVQLQRNAIFDAASLLAKHEFDIEFSQYFSTRDTSLRDLPFYYLDEESGRKESLESAEPLPLKPSMADFSHCDDVELQKLNAQVLEEPEEFEHWEKLVRAAEAQEGGLNRNSSPQAIAATRDTYDRFLARFPLFFGYWKKYADLEFAITGPEAAEMVYERGVASIGISVDLWANYCGFKAETTHDIDVIRDLFERGADSVGLDFLAHPFWDKYLEFEERLDAHDRIFKILDRIIHIPMHQYARYFERYRGMAQNRPLPELAPDDVLVAFRHDIESESGMKPKSEADIERELRTRVDSLHLEAFQQTQTETTKRWTYESEVKRPYYHVTELDEAQLANWRKYLDFEELEGDYTRIKFLHERCLVTAANYDEFWFRYARWMHGQGQAKREEVRSIYQRASCIFVPIAKPAIRLYYAKFEESIGEPAIAADIHEAILMILPNHLPTIISLANLRRRQSSVDDAIAVLKRHIDSPHTTNSTRGALVAEWARMVSDINGQPDQARKMFEENEHLYLDCQPFWLGWYFLEVKQSNNDRRVTAVYMAIREKSQLSPQTIEKFTSFFFVYLQERVSGDAARGAMEELMRLDQQVMKGKVPDGGFAEREDVLMAENGLQHAMF